MNIRTLRNEALRRAGGRCEECGSTENLQQHHVHFRKDGGEDCLENIRILCRACHHAVPGAHLGRPRLPVKFDRQVNVYLGLEEAGRLDQMAELWGCSRSEVIRRAIDEAAGREGLMPTERSG